MDLGVWRKQSLHGNIFVLVDYKYPVMRNIVGMFHLFYCLQCWNDELAMMRRYHSSQRRNLEDMIYRTQEYRGIKWAFLLEFSTS